MEKICIIGSLNMELILGPLNEIPAWRTQAFVEDLESRRAGSAASVAFPLAKLGVKSNVIGSVGNDTNGQAILDNIRSFGLSTEGIDIIEGASTGLCVSVRHGSGQRLYISHLGALAEFNEKHIARHSKIIQESKYLLRTGYFVLPGLKAKVLKSNFQQARHHLLEKRC